MEIIINRQELHCPLAPESAPWLVYPNGKNKKSYIFCSILEPSKTCLKRIPEMRRKEFISSSYGWLVMMACPQIFMFNPVSLETIHLPDIKMGASVDESYYVLSCSILFSAPTDPDCLILMSVGAETPSIMYCRPGDKQWTLQIYEAIDDNYIVEAVGLFDGTIYARTTKHNLVKIERDASGCLSPSMSFDVESIFSQTPSDVAHYIHYPILESCGEIFNVWQSYVGYRSDKLKHVIVFKMDFAKMAWVKVDDIGGRVFFLGESDCTSCFANQYSGLKGNCIYYTLTDDKSLYVYDMEDKSISISLPFPDFPRSPTASPYWVMPATACSQLERRKENEGRAGMDNENMKAKQCSHQESELDKESETKKFLVTSLPEDVQYMIAKHLTSVVDYMKFRTVCKTWRSIAPPIEQRSPWLMVLHRCFALFLDPECNSTYGINIPDDICDARIVFSKDGWWLISQGEFSMFFYNPLTKMRINVPDLPHRNDFLGFCFSSQPISSDCIIFGIAQFGRRVAIICLLHHGEEWTLEHFGESDDEAFMVSHNNPVFLEDAFYCLSTGGYLGVFDIKEGKWRVLPNPEPPCPSYADNYLIETDGELLSVFVSDLIGTTTDIFKLDRSTKEWVAVKSLGDRMLFLSHSTSLAVKAQEGKWEMQNNIYLPRVWNNNSADVVFYSLNTGSYRSSINPNFSQMDTRCSREHLNCTWFQPRFD